VKLENLYNNNMNYIDKVLEEFDKKFKYEEVGYEGVPTYSKNGNQIIEPGDIEQFIKQSLLTLQEQHEAEIKNKKYKEMLIEYMNDIHAIDENDALQQLAYEKGRHIAGEQHKKEIKNIIGHFQDNKMAKWDLSKFENANAMSWKEQGNQVADEVNSRIDEIIKHIFNKHIKQYETN
jgi:hypothetical protein